MIQTIPTLCPITQWLDTWNPVTSVLPDPMSPLDLRPLRMDWFELQDSLIGCWECPECLASGKIKPGVCQNKSLEDTIGLPGRFWSVIDGAQDRCDFRTAMLIALHAAWWSDDNSMTATSREFRMCAVESARIIHLNGNRLCTIPGLDEVVIADLLRRSCNFPDVQEVVMTGLGKSPDPLIAKALEFQMMKAATWDTLSYSFNLEPIDRSFYNFPNKYME